MKERSFLSVVIIPFLQAAISGFLVGIVMLAIKAEKEQALAAGGAWALLTWLYMLKSSREERRYLLGIQEPELAQVAESKQEPERAPLRVEIKESETHTIYAQLNITQEQLLGLARGISRGEPFSESSWCGARKLFTLGEFRELREELLKRRLLVWKRENYHAQGVELSPGARAFFRYCASSPTRFLESGKRQ